MRGTTRRKEDNLVLKEHHECVPKETKACFVPCNASVIGL